MVRKYRFDTRLLTQGAVHPATNGLPPMSPLALNSRKKDQQEVDSGSIQQFEKDLIRDSGTETQVIHVNGSVFQPQETNATLPNASNFKKLLSSSFDKIPDERLASYIQENSHQKGYAYNHYFHLSGIFSPEKNWSIRGSRPVLKQDFIVHSSTEVEHRIEREYLLMDLSPDASGLLDIDENDGEVIKVEQVFLLTLNEQTGQIDTKLCDYQVSASDQVISHITDASQRFTYKLSPHEIEATQAFNQSHLRHFSELDHTLEGVMKDLARGNTSDENEISDRRIFANHLELVRRNDYDGSDAHKKTLVNDLRKTIATLPNSDFKLSDRLLNFLVQHENQAGYVGNSATGEFINPMANHGYLVRRNGLQKRNSFQVVSATDVIQRVDFMIEGSILSSDMQAIDAQLFRANNAESDKELLSASLDLHIHHNLEDDKIELTVSDITLSSADKTVFNKIIYYLQEQLHLHTKTQTLLNQCVSDGSDPALLLFEAGDTVANTKTRYRNLAQASKERLLTQKERDFVIVFDLARQYLESAQVSNDSSDFEVIDIHANLDGIHFESFADLPLIDRVAAIVEQHRINQAKFEQALKSDSGVALSVRNEPLNIAATLPSHIHNEIFTYRSTYRNEAMMSPAVPGMKDAKPLTAEEEQALIHKAVDRLIEPMKAQGHENIVLKIDGVDHKLIRLAAKYARQQWGKAISIEMTLPNGKVTRLEKQSLQSSNAAKPALHKRAVKMATGGLKSGLFGRSQVPAVPSPTGVELDDMAPGSVKPVK